MNPASSNFTPGDLPTDRQRAMILISALCDDRLTAAEAGELQALVCRDVEIRRLYVAMMHLHAGLHHYASALSVAGETEESVIEETEEDSNVGMGETMVLPAMHDSPDESEEDQPQTLPVIDYTRKPDKTVRPYLKGGLAALLILGLGLLVYHLSSRQSPEPASPIAIVAPSPAAMPRPPSVAELESTASPVWASADMPPQDGGFIAGDTITLRSGAVQLKLHNGGQVVIEGPVEIGLVSDSQIAIHYGKLAATVPGGGLVVQCPTGSVTDLGTEFGVSVQSDGTTEVAVFKGRVSAALSSTATTQATQELTAGQSAALTPHALTVNPKGAVKQRYICNLSNLNVTSLDVTDMICGGDGTTRNRGVAVDQLTGSIGVWPPVAMRDGDGKYHKTEGYPVVDGAFVPQGPTSAMTVDSVGDQFTFDRTTNLSYNYIWTGGKIPWTDPQGISTTIDTVDYSTPEHAIICMHVNNAITLDLNAVRRMYPDRELSRFHCKFADAYVNRSPDELIPVANAIVLVDGKQRYEKLGFTNHDRGFALDLPLANADRFLTLVSTDAGLREDNDYVLWVDAKLELSQIRAKPVKMR